MPLRRRSGRRGGRGPARSQGIDKRERSEDTKGRDDEQGYAISQATEDTSSPAEKTAFGPRRSSATRPPALTPRYLRRYHRAVQRGMRRGLRTRKPAASSGFQWSG